MQCVKSKTRSDELDFINDDCFDNINSSKNNSNYYY